MKTILITGGSSGLGLETAKLLAADADVRLILACRNMAKANASCGEIARETGNGNVSSVQLDTSSLESVRACCAALAGETLDAIVCNAGASNETHGTSVDGHELVFATNHLGHFLLVNALLPQLADAARIVCISSGMHIIQPNMEWPGAEALLSLPPEAPRYSLSKLCTVYFAHELDRRLRVAGSRVTVNAFDPGLMTDTAFEVPPMPDPTPEQKSMLAARAGSCKDSARAVAALVADARYEGMSGRYFDRLGDQCASSVLSYSDANARELWNMCEKLTR